MSDRSRAAFYVVTGGPGSGKSTLLNALRERGVRTMPEAGRAIIQDQCAIGGTALPWKDRLAFAELMLGWEMRSHREAACLEGPVVFDRGVPDVAGYLTVCGLACPPHMERAARQFRYRSPVFIAPPWREIFHGDEERRQSWEEAHATYEAMLSTYRNFDYELVELPKASVEERTAFILSLTKEK